MTQHFARLFFMKIDKGFIRETLLSMRTELESLSDMAADNRKPVMLDQQSVGRLSRMDSLQVQAMDIAQEKARQRQIVKINAALKRLDDDDYGYCVTCDEPIGSKRLELDPAIPLCIQCAK